MADPKSGIARAATKPRKEHGGNLPLRIAVEANGQEAPGTMNPIDRAIREKRRLRFIYHDVARLVEPQCHGIGHRGTELLRAYQLKGGAQPEPLFDVSKISNLQLLDEHFEKPGPNYTRDDSAMQEIFAQL
jgi:predicted DNA-binding transcriptional regulator YafY